MRALETWGSRNPSNSSDIIILVLIRWLRVATNSHSEKVDHVLVFSFTFVCACVRVCVWRWRPLELATCVALKMERQLLGQLLTKWTWFCWLNASSTDKLSSNMYIPTLILKFFFGLIADTDPWLCVFPWPDGSMHLFFLP